MKTNKVFECREPRCFVDGKPRVFTRSALYRQHQLKVHAEKNLKCGLCPKTFSVPYLLKQHEKQCNQTLSCDTCGLKFNHQSSFRRHQKSSKHGVPDSSRLAARSAGVVLNIMPVQLVPVVVVETKETKSFAAAGTQSDPGIATTTSFRPIRPKSSPSTPVLVNSRESTAVQTSAEILQAPGPSIATQTVTSQCNVAVGIDEVFEDLEKLFAQAETQTHNQIPEANFHHAETQTNQPCSVDTDMQTIYDKLNNFSAMQPEPLPNVGQVDRILSGVEVQTSFERQMQHFGMQTVFPHDSKIAGTQTQSISSFDGQCQTGMELSSVETQTIEQFLSELENTT